MVKLDLADETIEAFLLPVAYIIDLYIDNIVYITASNREVNWKSILKYLERIVDAKPSFKKRLNFLREKVAFLLEMN